jgi:hypothetical protein
MTDEPGTGMVGLFWIVEEAGRAVLISHAVRLTEAVSYGDMLTVEMGHAEFWSELARRGGRSLSAAGIPSVPIWSDYDEWPRGRVLYDGAGRAFVIRADRQILGSTLLRLIADRFQAPVKGTQVFSDDHYRSVRRVPVVGGDGLLCK